MDVLMIFESSSPATFEFSAATSNLRVLDTLLGMASLTASHLICEPLSSGWGTNEICKKTKLIFQLS